MNWIHDYSLAKKILQKPGPLTPEEWEKNQHHPEIGYHITKNIPELSKVAEFILLHHERCKGRGNPASLPHFGHSRRI